jgi:hypothetical protein
MKLKFVVLTFSLAIATSKLLRISGLPLLVLCDILNTHLIFNVFSKSALFISSSIQLSFTGRELFSRIQTRGLGVVMQAYNLSY